MARTTSGDCQIKSSRLRRFSLNTVSGDFGIETPLVAGEQCFAKTVSGDLQLALPPDTGATVQLKSVSGSVECQLPAEIIKSGRRHWQGRINGGGASLEMSSISGDLTIAKGKQSGADGNMSPTLQSPRAPETQAPPKPAESRAYAQSSREDDAPFAAEASSTLDGSSDTAGIASSESGGGTTAILSALERGEITVEEAMERLEEAG